MNYKKFIYSDFVRNSIKKALPDEDEKTIQAILDTFYSKDLSNFKKLIYLPKIADKIEEYLYQRDDFLDGHKAELAGNNAIKLLYIPPFALSLSMVALLLNIVTVFGLLASLTPLKPSYITVVKLSLVAFLIYLPFQEKNIQNKILDKIQNQELKNYIGFINWVSYYERLNATIHK